MAAKTRQYEKLITRQERIIAMLLRTSGPESLEKCSCGRERCQRQDQTSKSGLHLPPCLQPAEELRDALDDSASSRVGRAMTHEENLLEIVLV